MTITLLFNKPLSRGIASAPVLLYKPCYLTLRWGFSISHRLFGLISFNWFNY